MEKISKSNHCPICGSDELHWGHSEMYDECYRYDFECSVCGTEGTQWEDLVYSHHEITKEGVIPDGS